MTAGGGGGGGAAGLLEPRAPGAYHGPAAINEAVTKTPHQRGLRPRRTVTICRNDRYRPRQPRSSRGGQRRERRLVPPAGRDRERFEEVAEASGGRPLNITASSFDQCYDVPASGLAYLGRGRVLCRFG